MPQASQPSLFPDTPPTPVLDIASKSLPKPKSKKQRSRGNIAYLPDGRLGKVLITNANDDCLLSVNGQPMVFAASDLSFCGAAVVDGSLQAIRREVYTENTALALAIHAAECSSAPNPDLKQMRQEYELRQRLLKVIDAEIQAREEAKSLELEGSDRNV